MKIKNFLFHRVNPERDLMWDPMDPKLFEQSIRYLKKNYQIVLLEEFILSGDYKKKHKKKIATILFDDGYKDNLEYAAPILKKYQVRASFYVVTNCIDKNTLTWTHIIDYAFSHTNKSKINFDFDFFPVQLRTKELKTRQERIVYASNKNFRTLIRQITHKQRKIIMDEIIRAFDDVKFPKLMMNWKEVKQLHADGHYIGSHTMNHVMLGTMENPQEIETELLESAKTMELKSEKKFSKKF